MNYKYDVFLFKDNLASQANHVCLKASKEPFSEQQLSELFLLFSENIRPQHQHGGQVGTEKTIKRRKIAAAM